MEGWWWKITINDGSTSLMVIWRFLTASRLAGKLGPASLRSVIEDSNVPEDIHSIYKVYNLTKECYQIILEGLPESLSTLGWAGECLGEVGTSTKVWVFGRSEFASQSARSRQMPDNRSTSFLVVILVFNHHHHAPSPPQCPPRPPNLRKKGRGPTREGCGWEMKGQRTRGETLVEGDPPTHRSDEGTRLVVSVTPGASAAAAACWHLSPLTTRGPTPPIPSSTEVQERGDAKCKAMRGDDEYDVRIRALGPHHHGHLRSQHPLLPPLTTPPPLHLLATTPPPHPLPTLPLPPPLAAPPPPPLLVMLPPPLLTMPLLMDVGCYRAPWLVRGRRHPPTSLTIHWHTRSPPPSPMSRPPPLPTAFLTNRRKNSATAAAARLQRRRQGGSGSAPLLLLRCGDDVEMGGAGSRRPLGYDDDGSWERQQQYTTAAARGNSSSSTTTAVRIRRRPRAVARPLLLGYSDDNEQQRERLLLQYDDDNEQQQCERLVLRYGDDNGQQQHDRCCSDTTTIMRSSATGCCSGQLSGTTTITSSSATSCCSGMTTVTSSSATSCCSGTTTTSSSATAAAAALLWGRR
ncbi:hypothetical protein BDZ97DRAFT_1760704 [Flammula alnicola]|nr:hypothetical protein BDZ97DRAFT_1760704 [Flammula alnicola]